MDDLLNRLSQHRGTAHENETAAAAEIERLADGLRQIARYGDGDGQLSKIAQAFLDHKPTPPRSDAMPEHFGRCPICGRLERQGKKMREHLVFCEQKQTEEFDKVRFVEGENDRLRIDQRECRQMLETLVESVDINGEGHLLSLVSPEWLACVRKIVDRDDPDTQTGHEAPIPIDPREG